MYIRFIYSAGKISVCNPGRCWRRPAPRAGAHQPGSGRGARARPKTGRARAGRRGSGQSAQTAAPAAGADLAPAHIQVPPAPSSSTPTALMCVAPAPVPTPAISMQQCVQRRSRPEQLLATSCKEKSRIRLESTIENLSE